MNEEIGRTQVRADQLVAHALDTESRDEKRIIAAMLSVQQEVRATNMILREIAEILRSPG